MCCVAQGFQRPQSFFLAEYEDEDYVRTQATAYRQVSQLLLPTHSGNDTASKQNIPYHLQDTGEEIPSDIYVWKDSLRYPQCHCLTKASL